MYALDLETKSGIHAHDNKRKILHWLCNFEPLGRMEVKMTFEARITLVMTRFLENIFFQG